MNQDEELLIRKAQRGNIAAFEELVKRYEDKVMSIIFNMLNDAEDARDVYQDVFMKVFLTIKKFRFQSKFYTWLFRIAVNTSINYRKKRTSQQKETLENYIEENKHDAEITIQNNSDNPEKHLLDMELGKHIQRSINLLSPKQKAVFVLRHYHGYKLAEIAEILNCAEGTVKNYLFRSLQKLKKELKEFRLN
ncbi:sigma-70 family RNA polymerase sigma factor [candidate division KSB1 bacterium]|nr:sigma-70 family RNA polymerase sigma factor [candidate division KSB1 bacterium]MBL7092989.1 sigma-70 family RNA polymerase sigma factor [candidate division KSB1 bacterium]